MTDTNKSLQEMQVLKGESVSRNTSVDIDNQTVTMFNVSKNDTTGHGYKVNWMFDFSNCTDTDILLLAARSTLIAYRKNFRKVKVDSIPNFAEKTIDVKEEVLNIERKGKTDEEKMKTLVRNMTPQQLKAALAVSGYVLKDVRSEEHTSELQSH